MILEQKFISGRNNAFITEICKLKQKKHRNQAGLFYVEGTKLFKEALDSGLNIRHVIIAGDGGEADGGLRNLILRGETTANPRPAGTPFQKGALSAEIVTVTREVYAKITDEEAFEGVMCVIEKPAEDIKLSYEKPVIVLCSVRDPGNVGTIIRTANAIIDCDMILSDDCADIYSSKTQRAAMGAVFRQNIKISKNIAEDIANLKKNGYNIIASHLDRNSRPIGEVKFNAKTAVIFGNEGNGLDDETARLCDGKMIIPINQDSESLNVSIAAGIVLWEMRRGDLKYNGRIERDNRK